MLTATERLATRAARAFGTWRRSLVAVLSGHLEYEDPATLRIRAKDFRAEVLDTLVGYLALGAPRTLHRDPARPLWEQADAVASEVWHDSPVDPWSVPEADIQAQLERMQHTELSIVDGPETEQPTVMVPDTVDELLELSGPAQKAPRGARAEARPDDAHARRHRPRGADGDAGHEAGADVPYGRWGVAGPVTS
ncbi:hypothetical protein GCM10020000_87160 [Streptomyces olivoverticillatus]